MNVDRNNSFHVKQMTRVIRKTSLVAAVALLSVALTTSSLPAQQDLPEASDLLEKSVTAMGGREAFDKIENRVSTGTLEFVDQGIEIEMKIVSARPNKSRITLKSDAIGEVDSGSNGVEVWEDSTLQGPALKSGAERASRLAEVKFERFVYWQDAFEKVETKGKEDVNGKNCFLVVLNPKNPTDEADAELFPIKLYIDEETYLVAKVVAKTHSAAGVIEVEVFSGGFREVDGIMVSHRSETHVLGQKRVLTIKTVEHNVELPNDQFTPPEDVQQLIDRRDK